MADLIRDEIQHAINARPAFDKKMSNNNRAWPEDRRDQEAGEEEDHEGGEHQQDPGDIKLAKEGSEQKKRFRLTRKLRLLSRFRPLK